MWGRQAIWNLTNHPFKVAQSHAGKLYCLIEILEHGVDRGATDRTGLSPRLQGVRTRHAADSVRSLAVRDDGFAGALHADHTDSTTTSTRLCPRRFAAVPLSALARHRFCGRSSGCPCSRRPRSHFGSAVKATVSSSEERCGRAAETGQRDQGRSQGTAGVGLTARLQIVRYSKGSTMSSQGAVPSLR